MRLQVENRNPIKRARTMDRKTIRPLFAPIEVSRIQDDDLEMIFWRKEISGVAIRRALPRKERADAVPSDGNVPSQIECP